MTICLLCHPINMYDIFGSKSMFFFASNTFELHLEFSHLHCLEFYFKLAIDVLASTCKKTKGGSRRAENYSQHEEIYICRSWMHISQDPIVGIQHKKSKFCDRIENHFKAAMFKKFGVSIQHRGKGVSIYLVYYISTVYCGYKYIVIIPSYIFNVWLLY